MLDLEKSKKKHLLMVMDLYKLLKEKIMSLQTN